MLVLVVRDNDWQIQSLSLGHYLIITAIYLHPLPPGPVVVPGDVHLVGPQLRHLHVHGAGVGVADLQDYYVIKVDKFLIIRIVSGEFIFILKMFTLQIVDKSTSYTFKIVN